VFLTVATAIYTALGGIKAVVWTDVIQVALMFGSLAFAFWSLLRAIPGGWLGATALLNAPTDLIFFSSGSEPNSSFLQNVRNVLGTEYSVWAAFFGATFITMATHGTDQDIVQRMLTAKNATRSRLALILSGLADFPVVLCFLSIGILLWAFYRKEGMSHPFAYYILHEMPSGVRGLMIAGVLATAMGSLSAALNALATSFAQDWYLPYIRPQATPQHVVAAARKSTVVFSLILVLIGSVTAYAVIVLGDSHCYRHLWVYLRLAFGRVPGRDADQDARQRQSQSRGDGVRIRRRGDPQRTAQRHLESAASPRS
jgi:Na+/proline symporter